MTWKTHLIGGAQAGIILAYAHGGTATDSALIIGASMVGSFLPDIDHARSKISRTDSFAGLISHLLSKFTKHRGFTHTIIGALAFALLFYALAVYKTERESLASMAAAVTVFIAIHAFSRALRSLAGWFAAAAYTLGPKIAELATEHSISLSLNTGSAILCSVGIFAGSISHMLYDTANKGGIPWLWPISKKNFNLLNIRTNTTGEVGFAAVQVGILSLILAVCCRDMQVVDMIADFMNSLFGPTRGNFIYY